MTLPISLPLSSAAFEPTASADRPGADTVMHVLAPERLDGSTAAGFRSALHNAVAVVGTGRVVVDLSAVSRLDAIGLGVLMGAHRRARGAGATLVVVSPPRRIATLLAATRLDRLLCGGRIEVPVA
jgi:anti-sigma B factor antagonist